MDFGSGAAIVVVTEAGLDQDQLELIWRLCTEAGMIFEDARAEAILIGQVPA